MNMKMQAKLTAIIFTVKKCSLSVFDFCLSCVFAFAFVFDVVRHYVCFEAALTASKTNANAIHCPPLMQAALRQDQ